MKLLIFIMLIPMPVCADICRVDFIQEYQRIDDSVISADDVRHELWVNGQLRITSDTGNTTRFIWSETPCPPCDKVAIRAIDIKRNEPDGLPSNYTTSCAPPVQPSVCF